MTSDCGWKPVEQFHSFAEYEELKTKLAEQVNKGKAKERRVGKPYSGLRTLDERWYRCDASGQVWRLVAPDPPFPGIFEPV